MGRCRTDGSVGGVSGTTDGRAESRGSHYRRAYPTPWADRRDAAAGTRHGGCARIILGPVRPGGAKGSKRAYPWRRIGEDRQFTLRALSRLQSVPGPTPAGCTTRPLVRSRTRWWARNLAVEACLGFCNDLDHRHRQPIVSPCLAISRYEKKRKIFSCTVIKGRGYLVGGHGRACNQAMETSRRL